MADEHLQITQFETWLDEARALAERKHFFHWELEFPNIFFNSQGQSLGERAGFDVVISNPPYVRQEQLSTDKPFFQEHFEVYHGMADLFVYFFAQGLRLLHMDGKLAYISSNSWLRANYATLLRQYLRTQTTVETIIDLGDNRVFADAPDLTPAIQIVSKTVPINRHKARIDWVRHNQLIRVEGSLSVVICSMWNCRSALLKRAEESRSNLHNPSYRTLIQT
jgi:hypothetical protein